ncbi:MAG: TonB-dependent receptor [Hylemonella sp.]|nr:TonB-dependent receptor [Hylemonella sp.]
MSFNKNIISVAVAAMGVAPLCAQTLDSVVVSASRAEQRSFDAPAAIESVDRETIQGAGPQVNLSESLNRVPGLTILNRQNYAQDLQVSIRGFGARSAFGIRGIRLLIDGIPATTPDGQGQGSSVSLTSAERIEVLRGPLALMYGNSAGGVIQAFTREAPEVPEFGLQYYTGSYEMRRSDWQYAGRIGAVGLVADYSTFDTNGFRDNSTTERKQFNSKLSFGPDAHTRVNLVFNQFDMPLAQDPAGLTAAQLAVDATQAGTNTVLRRVRKVVSQSQAGTSLTHALDDNRSVSARVYAGTRDNLQYQTGIAGVTPTGAWVGLNRAYYGLGLQYNEQTRVAAMPVRWVVGYEFDRSREYRQGGAAALGEKTTTTRREDNQADNSDLFAQATALVSERFSLTGGLRYSTVRMLSDDYYTSDGNGSGNVSYSAASPVLGVTWHASDSVNVYANYGKGFETPTLAEMAYNGAGTPAFNTSLSAASSQHYEVGAKWAPEARSRVDFTVFQINTTDEIVVASSNGGNSTFKNAPGTRRTGWELAGRTLLSPNWRATLSASAIEAQFSETFVTNNVTVNAGNRLPGIPQHFLFTELLWSAQSLDNAGRKPGLGTQAGAEVVSAGKLYANDSNSASAEGYTTLNLKASQGWPVAGKGSLTAYGRLDNVTDQRYVGSVIVNQAANQFYEPAPGFNWTLGVRLSVPL